MELCDANKLLWTECMPRSLVVIEYEMVAFLSPVFSI